MTEKEFFERVVNESGYWKNGASGYHGECVYCGGKIWDGAAPLSEIPHDPDCPVVYARARLVEMEEVESLEFLLDEGKAMNTLDELKQAFRDLAGVDISRLELGFAFHEQTPNAPTDTEARRAYNSQCAELYYAIMRQEDIERRRGRQK